MSDLSAPFPWFGGKSRIAAKVWARFGNVENYVEPFFGSGAVLLARPHAPKTETINDADRFVANFWRAVQAEPETVARHADWPVNETDLEARHYWLVTHGRERLSAIAGDPLGYDTQAAGWWVWGACAWIGSGWCSGQGPWSWNGQQWINDAGRGINRQLPHVGDAGQGISRNLIAWMQALADRLRRVRVACGDWSRVCGPSVTWRHGLTGVFLDPPYSAEANRAEVYASECGRVARDAAAWAIANGDRPDMRIAMCGYEGEHNFPASWSAYRWKTKGGFGSQGHGQGRENAGRECIWFSPTCLPPDQPRLFAEPAPRPVQEAML